MGKNYLHDCLEQFPDVSRQRFNDRPFDLKTIQSDAEYLRTRTVVSVRDIHEHFSRYFKDYTELWWFNRYWLFPSFNDLEDQEQTFNFQQLGEDNEGSPIEKEAIQKLLGAFRQIELVSIILRFIQPVSFGILSPPIGFLLGLRSGKNAVETYVNYLRNIRKICEKYEFRTVAETDMALWVLKHKCYDAEFKDDGICQEFKNDEFMLQLRAKNLVEPLNELSPAQLAKAFCGTNNHLAVLTGCYALEETVKQWASHEGMEKEAMKLAKKKEKERRFPTLSDYSEALLRNKKGKISSLEPERKKLKKLSEIRNKVFHAEIREPSLRQIRDLAETVWKIERRLKKHTSR